MTSDESEPYVLLQEGDATTSMYEQDALMCTEDGNIFIWAGATVGGGTRINWYTSFCQKRFVTV